MSDSLSCSRTLSEDPYSTASYKEFSDFVRSFPLRGRRNLYYNDAVFGDEDSQSYSYSESTGKCSASAHSAASSCSSLCPSDVSSDYEYAFHHGREKCVRKKSGIRENDSRLKRDLAMFGGKLTNREHHDEISGPPSFRSESSSLFALRDDHAYGTQRNTSWRRTDDTFCARSSSANSYTRGGRSTVDSRVQRKRPSSTSSSSKPFSRNLGEVESQLLRKVNKDIVTLEAVLEEEDAAMDERIRMNPWERLYVLNNPTLHERRNRVYQEYCSLLSMKEDIISGQVRLDLMKKEQEKKRIDALYSPSGVFNRLYSKRRIFEKKGSEQGKKMKSTRLSKGASSSSGGNNVPSFNNPVDDDGSSAALNCYDRLYAKGVASIKRKMEKANTERLERERKTLQEYALGRLNARLHAEDYYESGKKKKGKDNEQDSKEKLLVEQLNQAENFSEEKMKKLLRTSTLTREEEEKKFSILYKRGYIPKKVLEDRKREAETADCTFHPKINAYPSVAERDLFEESRLFQERKKNKELELVRNRKSQILHAKMKADHHFRRRVEMDPSIGERFMERLVVV